MPSLYEVYRPQTWGEVCGQDKTIRALRSLQSRSGFGGKAIWLTGLSGTGKTTIARLIAGEVAEQEYVMELDAETLTPAMVQDIEADSRCSAFGRGGRVYIVNEAHGLKWRTVRQLLVTLERISAHACWLDAACIDGGPVFCAFEPDGALSGRRLNDRAVARIVKAAAKRIGLTPEQFSGHSLRAGFVTQSYREGIAEGDIMKHTRHKSRAVMGKYRREGERFLTNFSAKVRL